MNNKQYWDDVHTVEASSLKGPAPYFLTSLDNPEKAGGITAGRVFDIPNRRRAAELIAGRTHRISTPQEIEQFHADLKRETEKLAALALDKKEHFALPPELRALVETAALIVKRESEKADRPVGDAGKIEKTDKEKK